MSAKDVSRTFKMPLRHWLVTIIDGGSFKGLIWTDSERTYFRLPWLKKGYPGWEDCESIVRAWADHQNRNEKEGAKLDFSTLKANFRNALRKSDDFEEIKEQSNLDQQMDNFKVYKVLTPDEVRQKSGEKLRKRKKAQNNSSSGSKFLCSGHNLDDGKKKTMNSKQDLDSLLGAQSLDTSLQTNYLSDDRSASLQHDSIQKEFLNPDLVQHNILLRRKQMELGVYQEEVSTTPNQQLHLSQVEQCTSDTATGYYNATPQIDNTNDFCMKQRAEVTISQNEPQSLNERLFDCGITPDKLHECTLTVSYNSSEVLYKDLMKTVQGYRICFGDQEKLLNILKMQDTTSEEMSDYHYPEINLPPAPPECEQLSKILSNTDLGIVLRYDPDSLSFWLKRLCQCQVFYIDPQPDTNEKNPIKIDRRDEVCIFSVEKYLSRFSTQCGSEQEFILPESTMIISIGSKSNIMPEKCSPRGLKIEITPTVLKNLNDEFKRSENVSLYFSDATPVEDLLRQMRNASIGEGC